MSSLSTSLKKNYCFEEESEVKIDAGVFRNFRRFVLPEEESMSVEALLFDTEKQHLIVGYESRKMYVWDYNTETVLKNRDLNHAHITDMVFWSDEIILVSDYDAGFTGYDRKTYEQVSHIPTDSKYYARSVFRVSPDLFMSVVGSASVAKIVMLSYKDREQKREVASQYLIRCDNTTKIIPSLKFPKCALINCRAQEASNDQVILVNYETDKVEKVIDPTISKYIYCVSSYVNHQQEEVLLIVGNKSMNIYNLHTSVEKIIASEDHLLSSKNLRRPNSAICLNNCCFLASEPNINIYNLRTEKNMSTINGSDIEIIPFKRNSSYRLRVLVEDIYSVMIGMYSTMGTIYVIHYFSDEIMLSGDPSLGLQLQDLVDRVGYMRSELEAIFHEDVEKHIFRIKCTEGSCTLEFSKILLCL